MKKNLLFLAVLVVTNIAMGQITFSACPGSFTTSAPNEYSLVFEGTDATGRNYYQTNPISGDQPCAAGACEFRVAWNNTLMRWEILLFQNEIDFSDATVVYHNSTASTPNPPSLNLGVWNDTTSSCGGPLTSSNGTFSGSVQDSETLSLNDLALLNTKITVYPNPVSQTIFVKSSGAPIKELVLYSILGNKVISKTNVDNLDVSALATGIYMLKAITTTNKSIQQKVLVN